MWESTFTASEWQTLRFALLWAFFGVALSDKKVEKAELEVLAKEIAEAGLYKDSLTREVFGSLQSDFGGTMQAFAADSRKALDGLQEAGRIVDAKAPGSANDFKRNILAVCTQAAQACGPLFGDKISDDEKFAIAAAAVALGYQV